MKTNIASLSKNCIRATARGERRSDKFLPFRAAPGAEKRCGLVFWTGERSAKNRTFHWNKASNPFNFGTGNTIPSDGVRKIGPGRRQASHFNGGLGESYEKGFPDRESKMEIMVTDCCPASYTKEI